MKRNEYLLVPFPPFLLWWLPVMFGSWRIRAFVASASVVAQLVGVVAQTTDAVCLPYFDWVIKNLLSSPMRFSDPNDV